MKRILSMAVCALLLSTAKCTHDAGLAPLSIQDAAEEESRIDRRFVIDLGSSETLSPDHFFYFEGATGPTECFDGECVMVPVTAGTVVKVGGTSFPLRISESSFEVADNLVVGFLGAVTTTSDAPFAGRFRVAQAKLQSVEFGSSFRLSVTSPALLPDDRVVRITRFSDYRCKGVCVWEGMANLYLSLFEKGVVIGTLDFDDHVGTRSPVGKDSGTLVDLRITAHEVRAPEHVDEGYVELTVSPQ